MCVGLGVYVPTLSALITTHVKLISKSQLFFILSHFLLIILVVVPKKACHKEDTLLAVTVNKCFKLECFSY